MPSVLCLVSPLYNTWYHFQFITSLESVATSHKQSIVYLQQTLTKGLTELNWKWYLCAAVTAAAATTVILVTQSGPIYLIKPYCKFHHRIQHLSISSTSIFSQDHDKFKDIV